MPTPDEVKKAARKAARKRWYLKTYRTAPGSHPSGRLSQGTCRRGHAWEATNLRPRQDGKRQCLACYRINQATHHAKGREERAKRRTWREKQFGWKCVDASVREWDDKLRALGLGHQRGKPSWLVYGQEERSIGATLREEAFMGAPQRARTR